MASTRAFFTPLGIWLAELESVSEAPEISQVEGRLTRICKAKHRHSLEASLGLLRLASLSLARRLVLRPAGRLVNKPPDSLACRAIVAPSIALNNADLSLLIYSRSTSDSLYGEVLVDDYDRIRRTLTARPEANTLFYQGSHWCYSCARPDTYYGGRQVVWQTKESRLNSDVKSYSFR